MKEVRIGIIGIGNMGGAHAQSIYAGNVPNLRLGALCDIDEKKCQWAKENFPDVPVFQDAKELIHCGKIDAVLVATPHYYHAELCMEGLRAGLHVLSEKPEGVYTRQARELNELAKEFPDQVFGIMFNQRTNPLFAHARELIQSGFLGGIKRVVWIITNWYRQQAYYNSGGWRATWSGEGGGVLLNQAPHNLDLWQWICGMPTRIRGFCYEAKYHQIEVEDDATIYAEYSNGATGVFMTTTGEYPGTNRLEISGECGKIVLEEGKMKIWKLPDNERDFCFQGEIPEYEYSEWIPQEKEKAHNGILENFTQAILTGALLLAPGPEGINELMISNAAYLSSWTDSWIDLPVDEKEYEKQLFARFRENSEKCEIQEKRETGYKKRWSVNW